jgi:hypothetical protein
MTRNFILLPILLLCCAAQCEAYQQDRSTYYVQGPQARPWSGAAELVSVADGNTVQVVRDNILIDVHLVGIHNTYENERYIWDYWIPIFRWVDVEVVSQEGPYEWWGYIHSEGYTLNNELEELNGQRTQTTVSRSLPR